VQPHLPERVATLFGRYRLGGQRTRVLRRIAAVALLIAAAALASISSPSATEGTAVLAAARDLPAGARLAEADVAVVAVRPPPDGLLDARHPDDLVGVSLSGPMRRGEIFTDARVVGSRGPDPGPGRAAVPVPLADGTVAALLEPGRHIVLVGVPGADGWSHPDDAAAAVRVLASDAVVLSVGEPSGGLGGGDRHRIVVVSVPAGDADAVTAAATAGAITVRFGP